MIPNEYFKEAKKSYAKFKSWTILITLLYEKTYKQSMLDKKIDDKEAQELKKIHYHYLHKQSDKMKNTHFKVEDNFGDNY